MAPPESASTAAQNPKSSDADGERHVEASSLSSEEARKPASSRKIDKITALQDGIGM
jgi:hypothetical protein